MRLELLLVQNMHLIGIDLSLTRVVIRRQVPWAREHWLGRIRRFGVC